MSDDGLTPGHDFLQTAALTCFSERYGNPTMHVNKQLSPHLEWVPALRFLLHGHINVFVEPSDDGPYPRLFAMKFAEVSSYPEPIAIYCVCNYEAITTTKGRQDLKRLKTHGFGLVTVDPNGNADVLVTAIPLVQAIPEAEFKQYLNGLPKNIRQSASEAFEDYRAKPVNGVKTLSELVEGMIKKAGQDAAKRGDITTRESNMALANVLDTLYATYSSSRASIGGARKFVNECRNLTHHWPKNKKNAYKKYSDCKHHFIEGLRTIQAFRTAMRSLGLTGSLKKV